MFVAAKCTQCGADLQVNKASEAAVCEHCGSAFVVDKAIKNYNIANAQINAGAVNVNIGGGDFIIEGGILKKYRGNDENVVIPNTVVAIGDGVFYDCLCVKSVVIPDHITDIGVHIFRNCPNLIEVTLPSKISRFKLSVANILKETAHRRSELSHLVTYLFGDFSTGINDDEIAKWLNIWCKRGVFYINGVDVIPKFLQEKQLCYARIGETAKQKIEQEQTEKSTSIIIGVILLIISILMLIGGFTSSDSAAMALLCTFGSLGLFGGLGLIIHGLLK